MSIDCSSTEVGELIVRLLANERVSEDLHHVFISSHGARRLAEAVQVNTTMQELRLGCIEMVSEGYTLLAGALKVNSTLQNLTIHIATAESFALVGEALQVNSTLQSLELFCKKSDPGGCRKYGDALHVNSTLRSLSLRNVQMTSEGCRLLCDGLKANSTLQCLDFGGSDVNAEDCRYLCDALLVSRTLQTLNLSRKWIGANGCKVLGEVLAGGCSLQSLDLSDEWIDAEGCKVLCEGLRMSSTLQSLTLSLNDDSEAAGCTAIGAALELNRALIKLVLWSTRIDTEGWNAIGRALLSNSTLQTLHLSIGDRISPYGCRVLGEVFQMGCSLRSLDVSDNGIDAEGCRVLCEGLQMSSTLKSLSLSGNDDIGTAGCTAIGAALGLNRALIDLNLRSTGMDAEGCHSIGAALSSNSTLQSLDLSFNEIDEGCISIASALQVNSTLINLDLMSTNMKAEGHRLLGQALLVNSTLLYLDIAEDEMECSPYDLMVFVDVLRVNKGLEALHFHSRALKEHDMHVALAMGLALRDCPRHHVFSLCEGDGSPARLLAPAHETLELPAAARDWDDLRIVSYFHDRHLAIALAFAMGQHERLGEESFVRVLDCHVVDVVLRVYFGMAA